MQEKIEHYGLKKMCSLVHDEGHEEKQSNKLIAITLWESFVYTQSTLHEQRSEQLFISLNLRDPALYVHQYLTVT